MVYWVPPKEIILSAKQPLQLMNLFAGMYGRVVGRGIDPADAKKAIALMRGAIRTGPVESGLLRDSESKRSD